MSFVSSFERLAAEEAATKTAVSTLKKTLEILLEEDLAVLAESSPMVSIRFRMRRGSRRFFARLLPRRVLMNCATSQNEHSKPTNGLVDAENRHLSISHYSISQMTICPRVPAAAQVRPSGANATALTAPISHLNLLMSCLAATSQTRIVPSLDTLMSRLLSGEKARSFTTFSCSPNSAVCVNSLAVSSSTDLWRAIAR